ncbi:MAG: MliC family protein [Burkholderiales bacterium]
MHPWTRIAALLGFLPLAACVGVQETVLPARIDYTCAGNKTMQVERAPDARNAAVLVDGKVVVLPRGDSAAQEKYSNRSYSLYLDGQRAMLEQDGVVLFGPCESRNTLPTATRIRD